MAKQLTPVNALCDYVPVVIANGASLSAAVNLNNRILTGIFMPAGWTAAGMSFQVSDDGVTYYDLQTDAAEYTAAAAAAQYIGLNNLWFFGARFVKVRSGTAAAAVNQGAARSLLLACGVPSIDQ